jgi:hypothetical protein
MLQSTCTCPGGWPSHRYLPFIRALVFHALAPVAWVQLLPWPSVYPVVVPHNGCTSARHLNVTLCTLSLTCLRLSRYISYPRTESSAYPSSFDVREVVEKQAGHPVWGAYVRTLLGSGGMQVCTPASPFFRLSLPPSPTHTY